VRLIATAIIDASGLTWYFASEPGSQPVSDREEA